MKLKRNAERVTYINASNQIVWQAAHNPSKIDTLDIDYMYHHEYFEAHSQSKESSEGDGVVRSGYHNWTHPITKEMSFLENKLSLEIRQADTIHLKQKWIGCKAYIANNTKRIFRFDADESIIYMYLQALNKNGQWHNIQDSYWSGCTGGHTLAIDPKQYWAFKMPLFKGNYETRLRLKVIYRKRKGDKEYNLYSNEIKMSINPAQFWRKPHGKLKTLSDDDDSDNLN